MSGYSSIRSGSGSAISLAPTMIDVDALLGEVADHGRGVGGLDVVDDDRLAEAVLLRQLLGGVDDRLVVARRRRRAGGGDAEHDLAVAVGVEVERRRPLVVGASGASVASVRRSLRSPVRRRGRRLVSARCLGRGGCRRCRLIVVVAAARGGDEAQGSDRCHDTVFVVLMCSPPGLVSW